MNLQYDKQVEITAEQYKRVSNKCSGLVATRVEDGRYYMKLWLMKYKSYVEKILL